MNKAISIGVAVCAAFATVWVLKPGDAQRASAPQRSAFLDGASIQVAVDGNCGTQADVSGSLVGGTADAGESPATSSPISAIATASAEEAPAGASTKQEEIAPPPGGTCGGHLEAALAEAAGASPAPAHGASSAAPAPAKENPVQKVRAPVVAAAAPAKPKPRRVQAPQVPPTAWWPASKTEGLNVLFVGEAAFGSAITVLTDGRFANADSANAHIHVRGPNAARVERRWQVATNPRMLLLPVAPGIYTVSIEPQFADASGRQLGSAPSGSVQVR
jgi:hypothetical protein